MFIFWSHIQTVTGIDKYTATPINIIYKLNIVFACIIIVCGTLQYTAT